jgi:hypothetical protein
VILIGTSVWITLLSSRSRRNSPEETLLKIITGDKGAAEE